MCPLGPAHATDTWQTEGNARTQLTSFTKLGLRAMPALASKTEERPLEMKSEETTSSSVYPSTPAQGVFGVCVDAWVDAECSKGRVV